MTTKTAANNAEAAYESAHNAAQDIVARISELLYAMPAPGSETKINWGHVGDLNEINSQLARVIDFMTGSDK